MESISSSGNVVHVPGHGMMWIGLSKKEEEIINNAFKDYADKFKNSPKIELKKLISKIKK